MRLPKKVAIVTGGNSGIGRATAIAFAKEGAKVAIGARDLARGEEVVKIIQKAGGEAIFVRTDVSNSDEVRNLVRTTVEKYRRLDVLANVAGTWEDGLGTVWDTSEESWDKSVNTNMKGTFLMMKYAIPEMIRCGGGSIVNVSSVGGVNAAYGEFAYGASKGGIVLMTKDAALDCASGNIRVNCICPGGTDTPIITNWLKKCSDPKKELDTLLDQVPMRKLMKPDEVANLAIFLASDEASALTGSIIPVDNGYLAGVLKKGYKF